MTSLKSLDLKSVPCPLNVVKIKLALEKLSKNEQLIVELDKGEPEEMVLSNLKEMGCLFKQINENEKFIKVKIFNESLNFIDEVKLKSGDTISLLRGGHGIEIEKSCKLIETKQGPYIPDKDKKRF